MRCCWPNNTAETELLLSADVSTEDQNAMAILQELKALLRALRLQSLTTEGRANEERLRMQRCVNNNNRIGARHHLVESKKLLKKYTDQLQRVSNLNEVIDRLETALSNLQLTRKLSGASVTLKQLVAGMRDPSKIMDDIRDNMQLLSEANEQLGSNMAAAAADDDIDGELEQLMSASMPNVPTTPIVINASGKPKVKHAE